MERSKVNSYIGFCKRARKITFGSGAIDSLKNGVYLLIMDGRAAKNTLRYALKYKNRYNCPLLICNGDFEEITEKHLCRLVAIRDRSLAEAILGSGDANYELYAGGDK